MTSKHRLFPNLNRRVTFDCFWRTGCSDSARCNANGSCVAASQAGGATFPQEMKPDNRPLSHMEILSAVAHHASEIARLKARYLQSLDRPAVESVTEVALLEKYQQWARPLIEQRAKDAATIEQLRSQLAALQVELDHTVASHKDLEIRMLKQGFVAIQPENG